MPNIRITPITSPAQRNGSEALRYAVLRQPWNQALETDTRPPWDDLVAESDDAVIGTARLFPGDEPGAGLVRGMAVCPRHQRQGIGNMLISALELRARGRGCDCLVANGRSEYLDFYRQHGFRDLGEGPTLFNAITHRRMEKKIDHANFQAWGLHLRAARNTDRKALQTLIFDCLAEFGMQPEYNGIDQDLDNIQTAYAGGAFWVLESKTREIVGSVAMLPLSPGVFELRRMYLRADQRKSGLGRALLGLALNWARHRGHARRIVLETATVLQRARELYLWVGFQNYEGELETKRCDQRMAMDIS